MASQSTLLGAAGEHYVMAQLLRRGVIAALAPTGVPNADIVVTDWKADGSSRCKSRRVAKLVMMADGTWAPCMRSLCHQILSIASWISFEARRNGPLAGSCQAPSSPRSSPPTIAAGLSSRQARPAAQPDRPSATPARLPHALRVGDAPARVARPLPRRLAPCRGARHLGDQRDMAECRRASNHCGRRRRRLNTAFRLLPRVTVPSCVALRTIV